jgi:PAS domain S-box-containing protein
MIRLPDGGTATVVVDRSPRDRSLGRLLRTELVASPLVIALAFLLLRLIASIALRPLGQITDAARRTTEGRRGERLRPHPAETELGQMAVAYDDMLDALEAAVADARQAQQHSANTQERDRRILETAHEAFVAVDKNGVIVDWNAASERTFGWSRAEALGRLVEDLVVPPGSRFRNRMGRERIGIGDAGAVGSRIRAEALHRDGHRFPVEITAWAMPDRDGLALNAFVRDLTESTRTQEVTSELAAVVQSTDEAIVSLNLDGTIVSWNPGAERMYGHTASEAVGQHVFLIVDEHMRPQMAEALEALGRGEPVPSMEVPRRRRTDGSRIDMVLTLSPVASDGALRATLLVARDVSSERRLASELDETLVALQAALEEARASEVATRRFLDDAAHQLRAPITGIQACAETLLRGTGVEDRDHLLSTVLRETTRASRVMSGLLTMARVNQGQALVRQPCDVVALCQDEADRIARVEPGIRVSVTSSGPTPLGRPVLDPQAVGDIVANLLDNARRHAVSRIDIGVRRDDVDRITLTVADDGPGLPAGQADAAFDRFVSLDGKGGSGLGLAIARALARAHGGELSYADGVFVLSLSVQADPALVATA